MEHAVEGKPGLNKGDSEHELDVKRNEVLQWLKDDVDWLRKHSKQKYMGKNFMLRVHGIRASIYGCSTLLSGLKDEELELRVRELEEKIKDAVVIPNESKEKNT